MAVAQVRIETTVTNELNDHANYLSINSAFALHPDISTVYSNESGASNAAYSWDNYMKKLIDDKQKMVVVPFFSSNPQACYPGTNTHVIMKEAFEDADNRIGLLSWNELINTSINDNLYPELAATYGNLATMQAYRYILIWTGWDGAESEFTCEDVEYTKPTFSGDEFNVNELYPGLGPKMAPYQEHIAYILGPDEPFIHGFDAGWLETMIESTNREGAGFCQAVDGTDLTFLSAIPVKVNFNPLTLLTATYCLDPECPGGESDVIPDNIDVLEIDPYLTFWAALIHEIDLAQEPGFYDHVWADTGLSFSAMRQNPLYDYPTVEGMCLDAKRAWFAAHLPDWGQPAKDDFQIMLDICYGVLAKYGRTDAAFSLIGAALGNLASDANGRYYDESGSPNAGVSVDFDWVEEYYRYARSNDRIIDLQYYMAGDVERSISRYEHITNMFLRRMPSFLPYHGIDDVNGFFLAGDGIPGIGDGWCPDELPGIQGNEVDFSIFDWKRLTGEEENLIAWSSAEKEALHELSGDSSTWWEELIPLVVLGTIPNETDCLIMLELLSDLYLGLYPEEFNVISDLIGSCPDEDDGCDVLATLFARVPDDPTLTARVHRAYRYLYYLLSQCRYNYCPHRGTDDPQALRAWVDSETAAFWIDAWPRFDRFGALGAYRLNQNPPFSTPPDNDYFVHLQQQVMSPIEQHTFQCGAQTTYRRDPARLYLRLRYVYPSCNAEFQGVVNYRIVREADEETVVCGLPGPLQIPILPLNLPISAQITGALDIAAYQAGFYRYRVSIGAETAAGRRFLIGNGSNRFRIRQNPLMVQDSVVDEAETVRVIDMNGDGIEDRVGVFEGSAVILVDDGTGELYNTGQYIGEEVLRVTVEDLNADGRPDVIVGTETGMEIHLNQVPGLLQFNQELLGNEIRFLACADVDHDDDLDLAAGNPAGIIEIYLNNGTGSFSPIFTVETQATESIELALSNEDEHPDLIVGTSAGEQEIFYGDGTGRFEQFIYVVPWYSTKSTPDEHWDTHLALTNTNDFRSTFTATYFDPLGTAREACTSHRSLLPNALWENSLSALGLNISGSIRILSDSALSGVVRYSYRNGDAGDHAMYSVPLQALDELSSDPQNPWYITSTWSSQYCFGDIVSTSAFSLMNPLDAAVSATVRYYDMDGLLAHTESMSIGPLQVAYKELSNNWPISYGSFEIEADGPLAGHIARIYSHYASDQKFLHGENFQPLDLTASHSGTPYYLSYYGEGWYWESWVSVKNPWEVSCDAFLRYYHSNGALLAADTLRIDSHSVAMIGIVNGNPSAVGSVEVLSQHPILGHHEIFGIDIANQKLCIGSDPLQTADAGASIYTVPWFESETNAARSAGTWISLQNPQNDSTNVTLTYYDYSGDELPDTGQAILIAPHAHQVMSLTDGSPATKGSIRIVSDQAIIGHVERFTVYVGSDDIEYCIDPLQKVR